MFTLEEDQVLKNDAEYKDWLTKKIGLRFVRLFFLWLM